MSGSGEVVFVQGEANEDIWDDSLLISAYDRAIDSRKKGSASSSSYRPRDWRLGENVRSVYEGEEYEAVIQALDHEKGMATVRYVGYNNVEKVRLRGLKESLGQGERDRQIQEAEGQETDEDQSEGLTSSEIWKVGDSCRTHYTLDQRPYEAIITRIDIDNSLAEVKFLGYDNVQANNPLSTLIPSDGSSAVQTQIESALREKMDRSLHLSHGSNTLPPPPPPLSLGSKEEESTALYSLLISWYQAGYHAGQLDALKNK
eukprot:TRINITY_DN15508_c0_g1_i1.p1 TRINITY_DN15508_c0_g1~~TRINITY_DN15508_c0_g1_i1.p1  ORF type:complete len:259 (-),score=76.37 TRINITY_DN15508_c0_g1_i1:164-940(-)